MRSAILLAACLIGSACAQTVMAEEPQGGARVGVSKWGAGDDLGAANYLDAGKVLEARDLIRTGKTYRLGMVVSADTPLYPPRFARVVVQQTHVHGQSRGWGSNRATDNDDMYVGWLGVGTQIDGLGHTGVDHIYYNQARGEEFAKSTGLTRFGLHDLPPIVTRGVMIDMAKFYATGMIPEAIEYTLADVKAAMDAQGVDIREGDVVLFHSGWLDLVDGDAPDHDRYAASEPGIGLEVAEYLVSKGVVAVGADTWGLEVSPYTDPDMLIPVHQFLLAHSGTYILENVDTGELAADGAHEFMFVLGPARIKGTVQMTVNPIAIR